MEKGNLNILFSRVPNTPDLLFVEVENDKGESVSIGKWEQRGEYQVLVIPDFR